MTSLSTRGLRAAASPLRVDSELFGQAVENHYHPTENPQGAFPMNVAENRLSWTDLRAKIEELSATHSIPDWVASYAPRCGAPSFREAAAGFLSRHLAECLIAPDHLCVSAGATGVIEMTAFILADPGDAAVIPAPAYPVYRQDLGNLSGVQRYDLVTHHEPAEIVDGPVLTIADLEGAQSEIEATGRRFRMLILTTPDNPTGGIYPVDKLREISAWCIRQGIHLIVNEIYGLSLIDQTHPTLRQDYSEEIQFQSFANIMAERESDRLHLWYSFSKDLGISGFRVGLLHSLNEQLLAAYENLNLTHSVSNHTQWVLQLLLNDAEFMARFVAQNQERLTQAYVTVVECLRRIRVPYVPSRGSHFVWIDLSEFLPEDSENGELALWRSLYERTGVLLTPGAGFGHTKRGLFRVVFPCLSASELPVAMDRLAEFVEAARRGAITRGAAQGEA